jgi:hypothetical protein
MRVAALALAAVSVGASCTPLDACGVVVQQLATVATAVTSPGGVTISPYAVGGTGTPNAGGVVVTGACEDTELKDATISCTPAANDGACASCLGRSCCSESYAWLSGSDLHGVDLVACVDKSCATACPRAQ